MKYEIKAKKTGRKTEIHEVRGIRALHETLSDLRAEGMRIIKIKHVMVR